MRRGRRLMRGCGFFKSLCQFAISLAAQKMMPRPLKRAEILFGTKKGTKWQDLRYPLLSWRHCCSPIQQLQILLFHSEYIHLLILVHLILVAFETKLIYALFLWYRTSFGSLNFFDGG